MSKVIRNGAIKARHYIRLAQIYVTTEWHVMTTSTARKHGADKQTHAMIQQLAMITALQGL